MNAAAKGWRNEHRRRDLLEAEGYAVTRAAGSLGLWDLVGIGPADVVVVHVKSNRAPALAERAALAGFPLIHVWHDRARASRW